MEHVLTSKCQVTIPKAMREFIGVEAGDAVVFEPLADGRLAIVAATKKKRRKADALDTYFGTLPNLPAADELMSVTRGEDWNQP